MILVFACQMLGRNLQVWTLANSGSSFFFFFLISLNVESLGFEKIYIIL